jgi:hypothetical protein
LGLRKGGLPTVRNFSAQWKMAQSVPRNFTLKNLVMLVFN